MEFNNKKLEKTSKFINYLIAIVLCGFLIALSGKLMDDVDHWKERPQLESFENLNLITKEKGLISKIDAEIDLKSEQQNSIQNTLNIANNKYSNAKKSFDNWLAARKTIGSPKEDDAILERANKLDEYYKTQQESKKKLADLKNDIYVLGKDQDIITARMDTARDGAYELQTKAIQKYDLKVFLIRLMFILPILLIGIFFIVKLRKHKYWPLFLGFVLFSFYAFFVGLIPYLPSYGGYIRYSVGIILSVLFGIYALNKIKEFIERKKRELKAPTTERAKKVQTDTAEKALDDHMCPSCGKDFIVKKWDKPSEKKKQHISYGVVTNFCRFCGLELFKPCGKCGEENFVHLPFCASCGDPVTNKVEI
ncbi:MAG: hypothetical protein COB98_04655 [Flavobacteriaceae bacterium]|nr:MAG: hypothetical protein COB98_04655 [Flavobacteriaceae bacterium]